MKLCAVSSQVPGPPSCWAGPWGSCWFVSTWTGVPPLPVLRPETPESSGARSLLFPPGPRDDTAGEKLGQGNWGVGWKPIRRPGPGPLDPSSPPFPLGWAWLPENAPRCPGACEVHKTWLAQGAGRGSAGGGLPAGSLQAAAGVIVSPSPSVNAEPIEAETQTVPTGPLAKGGVARPGQNHWLCKQQGLLCLGGSWWGY